MDPDGTTHWMPEDSGPRNGESMEGPRQAGGSLGPVVRPGGAWPGARQPPPQRIRGLCLQRAGQPHLPETGWQAEPRPRGTSRAIPQEGESPEVSAEPGAECREVPAAGVSAEPETECPVVPGEEDPA